MGRCHSAALVTAFFALVPTAGELWAQGPVSPARFVPGEVLVRPAPGATVADLDSIRARFGAARVRTLLDGRVEKWALAAGAEAQAARLLTDHALILWAEPNYLFSAFATVPNDPGFGNQWGHSRIASTTAWDTTTGSGQVVIAVIDTGVDPGHPDLAAKLLPGHDFVDDDSDPTDLNGHGTNVAGVAAAVTNNGLGVAGTSWGAAILPVRVLDADGYGTNEDITDGITWATSHGARVLNLSLGGPTYAQAMQDAVNAAHAAGRLVVAAMGNYRSSGNPTAYPAAYENAFAVAATDRYDSFTWYSQYGPHCDIAAPGGAMDYYHDPDGVYSTMPTYACTLSNMGYYTSYDYMQGTSQAAPFVAGLAALVLSVAPNLGPDAVQAAIEQSATDRGPAGWDQDYGWGLIHAAGAVEAAVTVFSDGFESGTTGAWS